MLVLITLFLTIQVFQKQSSFPTGKTLDVLNCSVCSGSIVWGIVGIKDLRGQKASSMND